MNCPFCNINKQRILKKGKNVKVVLSNPRLMPGHLLIIPNKHVEKISQLTKEEQNELLDATIEFQEKILFKIAQGCDIAQHYRPFIKDNKLKVSHLHVHLLPREFEDELYQKVQIFDKDIFKDLTDEESNRMISKLK